jgi:hypothetical protein
MVASRIIFVGAKCIRESRVVCGLSGQSIEVAPAAGPPFPEPGRVRAGDPTGTGIVPRCPDECLDDYAENDIELSR